MKTKFFTTSDIDLLACAEIIKNGGLVAFPTETVYGLGANGFSGEAVKKIFAAKGRPCDNPLILHISDIETVNELYETVPEEFYTLTSSFFPGALTVICKKHDGIPNEVTAGLDTVAVRCPDNSVARRLIEFSNCPIAAPSANISGMPSPTTWQRVAIDMDGKIDAIIMGEPCKVGVESTVLSLVDKTKPTILRPGGVTKEMLEKLLGKVYVSESILSPLKSGEQVLSPGMKYKHYSPKARVLVVTGNQTEIIEKTIALYGEYNKKESCVILCSEDTATAYENRNKLVLGKRAVPEAFIHSIFEALRSCDDNGYETVLCEAIPAEGVGMAYMNRVLRAAAFQTV